MGVVERGEMIEPRIKNLLKKYPETRKLDNALCMKYWQKYDGCKSALDIIKATSSESITRARRKVQKDNPDLIDKETQRQREFKQVEYQARYRPVNEPVRKTNDKYIKKFKINGLIPE